MGKIFDTKMIEGNHFEILNYTLANSVQMTSSHQALLAWGASAIPALGADLYKKLKVTIIAFLISCLNIMLMILCQMLGPYHHVELI